MPRKKKAQGEFVWIHFGEHQDTHHAQLVRPMAENPPDDLNDDDSVEIVYTTSMMFAKVSKDSIEYPKQQQEEQHQEHPLADDGGHSSPNKISNATSPTRRSSRKRKSMSGTSSSLSPPSSSSSIKKSVTKNKSNKTGNSSSNRISRRRRRNKSSENNGTDLDENRITNSSPGRHQSSNMKKQLHFDSDDDEDDDEDTESNEAEEDTQDLRNKSKKSKIDDKKMEGEEQSTSLPSSSFLGTLAAPFMGIFNNLFGSGGGNVNKSS